MHVAKKAGHTTRFGVVTYPKLKLYTSRPGFYDLQHLGKFHPQNSPNGHTHNTTQQHGNMTYT